MNTQVDSAWLNVVAPIREAVRPFSSGLHHTLATFVERYAPKKMDAMGSSAGTMGLQAASTALSGYAAAFNGTQGLLQGFLGRVQGNANATHSIVQSVMSRLRIAL
jgi:hypothetical protein